MVRACTIIARNYLAHARVLAKSFFAHHPDGTFTVLIVDDERRQFDESNEAFTGLRLSEIGLEPAEIGRLASIYDVTELATAVKPPLLRHLLRHHSDIIYIDPDTRIYGSLERASQLAREHGVVLTPHMTAPLPRDGRRIDEFHILSAGIYNLGFIAVGASGGTFIDWWWQKTRRDAFMDPSRMMFTDQRWVDFVPSLFDHFILKDPTYNVAYWNLHARELTWNDGKYLVDGTPLTFFHFSGLDAKRPYLLSKHQGDRPRILLSERPALARICREYLDSVAAAGHAEHSRVPYGWTLLPSGVRFDHQIRRVYRQGLEQFEKGTGPEPPEPYDAASSDRFFEWLNEPVGAGLRPRVSRYLDAIYQGRPDLQQAFPNLAGPDWQHFASWARTDGVSQLGIPEPLLPRAEQTAHSYLRPSELTPGVNVAGYFRAELGVGEAARLLTDAVKVAEIPYSTVTYSATSSRKAHDFQERGDGRAPHEINIVCVNADRTPNFAADAGRGFFDGRYTVGYWFWELEDFPSSMHPGFDHVDEVWTATEFVAKAIRAIGRRPVHTIPLPVPIPPCSPDVTRDSLGLPASFMFLFMFDFFSIIERKNPIGVIRAFAAAFQPGEGPVLVVKTINGDSRLNDLERLRAAAAGRPDVLIVDEYYSAEQKNSLLALCDCYVSLHRSEGLGLTMAEAMGLGKPVIATAYSGNLHFMTPENSYLVDCSMVPVGPGNDPYPEASQWAQPDLDQAARLMRRVYERQDEAALKAHQARQDILTRHNAGTSAVVIKRRLDEIQRASASGEISPTPSVSAPSAPESSLLATLDHLATRLTPEASVEKGRRLRGPVLQAQRWLFKVLRPYWWQQRDIQSTLLNGVRQAVEASARAARAEPGQREALQAVWTAIHELRADLASSTSAGPQVESRIDRHEKRTIKVEDSLTLLRDAVARFQTDAGKHLVNLTTEIARAESRIDRNQKRTDELEGSLTLLHDAVTRFQTDAGKHLLNLTTEIGRTTDATIHLQQRLYATPYMADPSKFVYTDQAGQEILGFRGRRQADADVYAGFEDVFRGPESLIHDRFRVYLPLLKQHRRVLDIGCGRGELLDILRDAGIDAIGIDTDASMVERCRQKGHIVEQVDALAYLRSQDDASVPAIFAAQVIEHLPYPELLAFFDLSRQKLQSGGQLIFETVNPHALEAFKTFYTDLTHQKPIFPEVAIVLCWLSQFDGAYVFYPNGVGDATRDRMSQGEYAVVASKGVN